MKIIYSSIIAFTLLTGASLTAFAAPNVLKVETKRTVEYGQFMDDLKMSDVIFIGETHDEKKHHENQLEIIKSLHAKKVAVSIGLEMFALDSQQHLDDWISGKLDEQSFKKIYTSNWSYDWQWYRELFMFAREKQIPMIALNVPKPIIAKIMKKGPAALDDADRKLLPADISWTLNPPQTEYLRRITAQVFQHRPVAPPFANFCAAQALRNNVMAWSISKHAANYPKNKTIVLTGTWHAIKNGAPEHLAQYGNRKYTVILPEVPDLVIEKVTPKEADYFILK